MRNWIYLAAGAAVLPLCLAGGAKAAGGSDYGGKLSLTIVHQEAKPLDDKGHVVMATTYKGTNVSTGRQSWQDGADVVMVAYADLVQGNGASRGFGVDMKDGVAKPWSYVNKVKTVMVNGLPRITTEGEVTKLIPAPMRDIRSHCVFTSQTTLECEWSAQAIKAAAR